VHQELGEPYRNNKISAFAHRLGAARVHLVAHSKGGLDARRWLATFYAGGKRTGEPMVLTLATPSTPHNGSALADLAVARHKMATADVFDHIGFPRPSGLISLSTLMSYNGYNVGYESLRPSICAEANARELPAFPAEVFKCAAGADMDQDASGVIDHVDEIRHLSIDSDFWAQTMQNGAPATTFSSTDTVYQFLRLVRTVEWRAEHRIVGPVNEPLAVRVAVLTAAGSGPPDDTRNDVLVTESSGRGDGSFGVIGQPAMTAVFDGPRLALGPGGVVGPNPFRSQNHSSIGGRDVAATVAVEWLLFSDSVSPYGGRR